MLYGNKYFTNKLPALAKTFSTENLEKQREKLKRNEYFVQVT